MLATKAKGFSDDDLWLELRCDGGSVANKRGYVWQALSQWKDANQYRMTSKTIGYLLALQMANNATKSPRKPVRIK